jgi:hypothetical protein
MKLLLVTRWSQRRAASPLVHKYVTTGKPLGHTVAIFGEPRSDMPALPSPPISAESTLRYSSSRCRRTFRTCRTWRACWTVPRERRVVLDLWDATTTRSGWTTTSTT